MIRQKTFQIFFRYYIDRHFYFFDYCFLHNYMIEQDLQTLFTLILCIIKKNEINDAILQIPYILLN